MRFRFVVLTAVSDPKQAEREKDSLDDQLRKAVAFGEQEGGEFLREYRADGYSRTGYWDLSQAFADIPAFGEIRRDVYQDTFDVVIVDSYDRLGSTVFAFWEFLKPFKKQFRSTQQALRIEDPATYNPSRDDSTTNMIVSAMMVQGYRINKITRAFEIGNARRARDGKPNNACPYGYIKVNKNQIVINDAVAPLIRNFTKWYLEGVIMSEIVRRANASGIPARKGGAWSDTVILQMLKNPFFAGKTFYGRYARDQKGYSRVKREPVDLYDGQHEPLWSYETHLQLQKEIARRHRTQLLKRDYNFTGLLKCAACRRTLRITYASTYPDVKKWRCPEGHVRILAEDAERMVADELVRLFRDRSYTPTAHEQATDQIQRELSRVKQRLARLDEENEAGAYSTNEFVDKRKKLLARLTELENDEKRKQEIDQETARRVMILNTMHDLLPGMHIWIRQDDPRVVKYYLSLTVKLTAHPKDGTITAELL
jgi:hypothetical protein